MKFFYTLGIYLLSLVLQVFSLFNQKIKLGVAGRKNTFLTLKNSISKADKTIWMHCASLGEYEQGLPVLQELRKTHPEHKIVVSFFSPSGYENKKNAKDFDLAVYLPLDTPKNANYFLDLAHPELILFVKYEVWPNLLLEAKKRTIKSLLISATFRKNQSYFKWYGSLMRKALFSFEHIFTQDENSKQLIESIGYTSVSVSGDTRFDRVYKQLEMNNYIDFIEEFKGSKITIVFGSSWPADDSLFVPFINSYSEKKIKYIVAPHNTKPNYIESLENQINLKTVRFSKMEGETLSDYDVFILDTIGYLSRVYSYADIAYVGGGAGKTGLHNILEPAVFGIPILIGKNYEKFPEAKMLTELKGVISIPNSKELHDKLQSLIESERNRKKQGLINKTFIKENKGAVIHIVNTIRT
ncbi:glycosyltransferase N-terminal domain-containing protein [Winogradskyella sp.]|uniref:3-deoxy-D-manno-octulosonic acid transferase n=1 Tax=Winogradskyella sp. TaxID=1883156 RepID=UPI0025FE203A|nr:glycosyltransferase N-terminal domain-containing protein [Winogradskyella sp.]MBT8244316.1 3-deoxy-D-manno-octulosonic acid transferase [Winogradskyella sp.]